MFSRIKKNLWINIFIILVLIVLLIYPFSPLIDYYFGKFLKKSSPVTYLSQIKNKGSDTVPVAPDPKKELLEKYKNQPFLIIDKIDVFSPIFDGQNEDMTRIMEKGVWHYPDTVEPGEKGNAVIIGHRFRYKPPSLLTFYLLDKLTNDDEIKVQTKNKTLVFKVTDVNVLESTDWSSYEQNISKKQLQLITCTPLFTSEKRLVVTTELVE